MNYQSKKQDWLTRRLWKAAGTDEKVLQHCSYSDHVKYAGIGAIVIFTAILAALSAGFAFYAIFSDKRDWALENAELPKQWGVIAGAAFFAFVWGLMIYNLDRFIIAATGKGDGKEGISKEDIKSGWPRMLLALIIGVVISAPLEVKIMEKEINAAIQAEQRAKDNTSLKELNDNFYNQNRDVVDEMHRLEKLILEKDSIANMKENEATAQASGRGRIAGEGPGFRDAKTQAAAYRTERDVLREQKAKLEASEPYNSNRDRLKREQDAAKNEVFASAGLMKRIAVAHEIGGLIPYVIMLFFIILELTPVLTKMMLIKSPYDYLDENLQEIIKARQAIEIRRAFMKDENGKDVAKPEYYVPNQIIREQDNIIKAQEELSAHIVKLYLEREKAKIDANLDDYLVNPGETDKA